MRYARKFIRRILPRGPRAVPAMLASVFILAGCEGLFDAEDPGAITEDKLANDAAVSALVNGVIGEYDEAHDDAVLYAGLLSDEVVASGSWPPWHTTDEEGLIPLDAPIGAGNIPEPMWDGFQEARFLAEETYRRIQEVSSDPTSDERAAMARLYAGMIYRGFADYFCAAAYDAGPMVERARSYELAEERLSEAIAIAGAAGVDSIAEMAYLQRAHVRLMAGDPAGALSDAQQVGSELRWVAHFSSNSGETNGLWNSLNDRGEGTIGPRFQNTGDPRVVLEEAGETGPDGATFLWHQQKYPDEFSDMPIGTWQEARLIAAEVLIQDDVPAAVGLMNEVRAAAGLGSLDTGMTAAEATDALRDERAYELFLEAKRFGDMRRYGMFPADWEASCIPISRTELDANPNL